MKNTTKSSTRKTPAGKTKRQSAKASTEAVHHRTWQDFKTATLITSGLANLFVLIGWAVIQTTSQYDAQVVSLLFR